MLIVAYDLLQSLGQVESMEFDEAACSMIVGYETRMAAERVSFKESLPILNVM